jgi:cytochrome c553
MNKNYYKIVFTVLLVQFAGSIYAADISAGKNKASICLGCHGANGVSNNPIWPSLAGQQSAYLAAQLENFKSAERNNSVMTPMAKGLSNEDIQNLAAYFSSLPAKVVPPSTVTAGKDKVAMCAGCHGAKFDGKAQFPKLAGQNAQYLSNQLHDFKNAKRTSGPMNAIAKGLSDEDITVIANYLSNQPN